MEPTISRHNSWSTGRTLIGSDSGRDSLSYSSLDGTAGQIPIVQTLDNKQWVDLDHLSPKAIRELRRQYGVINSDEPPGTLAKGAAKLKAWIRLSKAGVDVRLRHKVSADRDEVNIYHLKPAAVEFSRDEKSPLIPELDGTPLQVVAELEEPVPEFPDTSRPSEIGPSVTSPAIPPDRGFEEPLPRYEPRSVSDSCGDRDASEERPAATVHRHSASQESIDLGPEVLSLPNRTAGNTDEAGVVSHQAVDFTAPTGQDNTVSKDKIPELFEKRSGLAEFQTVQDRQVSESLQEIIALLHKKLVAGGSTEDKDIVEDVPSRRIRPGRLQVTSTESYETETDGEPSLVRKKTAIRPKNKRSAVNSPKRRKSGFATRSPLSSKPSIGSDDDERPAEELLRKPTLPKRSPASAGPEAIWQSLLQSQAKILGAENPMVYQARFDLAQSRASGHADCPQHLAALQKTRQSAVQMLGIVHPWVAAFCDELERLEVLMGAAAEVESADPYPARDANAAHDDSNPSVNASAAERSARVADPEPPMAVTPPAVDVRLELPRLDVNVLPPSNDRDTSSAERPAAVDAIWNASRQPHQPQHGYSMLSGLLFDSITNVAINSIQWLQRNYGPEQSVEPGKVRVRWTCRCGEQLHDDFVEIRNGAARELEAYLNRPRTMASGNTPTSPSSSYGTGSFMGSSVGGTGSPAMSWSSYGSQVPSFPGNGNDTKSPQNATGSYLYPGYAPLTEPPWLLTCANEDRYTPKLAHLDMGSHHIRSDKDLALSLRQHYFQVNKKWWRSLRIRGLTTIEFVQFEVHQNRFADIRKCPDIPPHPTKDYDFMPADLLPPVGSQYLLHLFKHPGDYDGELITYIRSPKRNGRLQSGVGWGINLVEGFLADRVWMVVSTFFTLASLAFVIAWAAARHDVQGASGVAAWIVALCVLAIGWLQAFLG